MKTKHVSDSKGTQLPSKQPAKVEGRNCKQRNVLCFLYVFKQDLPSSLPGFNPHPHHDSDIDDKSNATERVIPSGETNIAIEAMAEIVDLAMKGTVGITIRNPPPVITIDSWYDHLSQAWVVYGIVISTLPPITRGLGFIIFIEIVDIVT